MGPCRTLGNESSEETHVKEGNLIGKGRPGRQQDGKGTQEDCSAMGLTGSGFMMVALVSGLSLARVLPGGSRIA